MNNPIQTSSSGNYIQATIIASDEVDLSQSEIVIKQRSICKRYMWIDWESMLQLVCNLHGKVTMKDMQVFAAVCTFIQPKTTKAPFTRKALMNKLPTKISKAQLSISLKHLVEAGILYIDAEDVYNVNPDFTFNGKIRDYH